jgi:hypothetical protein
VSDWDDDALADLRHHWGEAYLVHRLGARWVAQRRDSRESMSAAGPEELRELIVADYAARPVPRDT